MKRVLIIGIVLVAIWLIFQKANEEKTEPENKEAEQTQELNTKQEQTLPVKQAEEKEVQKSIPSKTTQSTTPTPVQTPQESQTVTPVQSTDSTPADYTVHSKVKVYLYEWNIDMSQDSVSAGNVEFTVVNNGQFTHHFAIKGVEDFGKVLPGTTRVFMASLGEGKFEIYSPRNIDLQNNMSQILSVGK